MRTDRERNRSLPARSMAYFSIGMALHSEGSYEDVLALLTDGLSWTSGEEPIVLPSKSAIFQARSCLGSEPLQMLFAKVARPLAKKATPGAFLGGRRLVAIDRTCLDVADTADNDAFFGRPGVMKGEQSAFPQARVVAVAECATHAIFDAVGREVHDIGERGGGRADRPSGARDVVSGSTGGFAGFPCGHGPLPPVPICCGGPISNMKPRFVESLHDGSWLAELRPSGNAGRRAKPLRIRVIDYSIDDGRDNDESYRLFTTILDPNDVSALDLAAAYTQRWEIESAFDELKTHQRGSTYRVAIQVAGPRTPRDLGPSVLSLRHPHPHVGGR